MMKTGKLFRVAKLLERRWNYAKMDDMKPFFRGRYVTLRYPAKVDKSWKSYRRLLMNDDTKSLGVFHVMSNCYWINKKDSPEIISAWDKTVDKDFTTNICMQNSDNLKLADIDTLKREYRVTDESPFFRSALLTHNRYTFVREILKMIEKKKASLLHKDFQTEEHQVKINKSISELYVYKDLLNKKDLDQFNIWFDMVDFNSFLLHLNDTREGNTPIESYNILDLRPFKCKRIELVVVTFLDGLVADKEFRGSYKWFYGEMSTRRAKELRSKWNFVINCRTAVNLQDLVEVAAVQWLAFFFVEAVSKKFKFYDGLAVPKKVDDAAEVCKLNTNLKEFKADYANTINALQGYFDASENIPDSVKETALYNQRNYTKALDAAIKWSTKHNLCVDFFQEELDLVSAKIIPR